MSFEIGDRVIHCYHGPGRITRLDKVEARDGTRECYVVSMGHGLVVWVPIDGSSELKLRSPMTRDQLESLRQVLRSPAKPVQVASREREQELKARLREGSAESLCTILRDLTAYSTRRSLNASDTAALDKARTILVGEWESATGSAEAAEEVDVLLHEVAREAIRLAM